MRRDQRIHLMRQRLVRFMFSELACDTADIAEILNIQQAEVCRLMQAPRKGSITAERTKCL